MAVADLTLEGLVHDLNNVFQTIAESAELLGRRSQVGEAGPHAAAQRGPRASHRAQHSRNQSLGHRTRSHHRERVAILPGLSGVRQRTEDRISVPRSIAEFRLKGDRGRMGARLRESLSELGAGRREEYSHSRARQRNRGERRRARAFRSSCCPESFSRACPPSRSSRDWGSTWCSPSSSRTAAP